jgi:hypothetical protein
MNVTYARAHEAVSTDQHAAQIKLFGQSWNDKGERTRYCDSLRRTYFGGGLFLSLHNFAIRSNQNEGAQMNRSPSNLVLQGQTDSPLASQNSVSQNERGHDFRYSKRWNELVVPLERSGGAVVDSPPETPSALVSDSYFLGAGLSLKGCSLNPLVRLS